MAQLVIVSIDSLLSLGDSIQFQDRNAVSQAFEYYDQALKISKEEVNQDAIFRSLERIVNLYAINDEEESNWQFYLDQLQENVSTDLDRSWYEFHQVKHELQRNYRNEKFDIQINYDCNSEILKAKDSGELILQIKIQGLCAIYTELTLKDFDAATSMYKKNVELCDNNENEAFNRYKYSNLLNLGNLYQSIDSFEAAIQYYKKGLSISDNPTAVFQNQIKAFNWISDTYKELGQLDSALYYQELRYEALNTSDRHKHNQRMYELEEQYQNEILSENLDSQKVILNRNRLLLALSIITICAIGFSLYQKLAENELIKRNHEDERIKANQQAELMAISARLDGAEQERIRVAQVLHDSIASQLTTADFQMTVMRAQLRPDETELLDKSVNLIQASSQQVRELSHELVPPVLLKLGLIPALQDLCHKYSSEQLSFTMGSGQSDIEQISIDRDTSFTIYLITQELLQNILKHSDASEVSIRHYTRDEQLTIEIRDNSSISLSDDDLSDDQSLGLISLRTRIESLGGSFSRKNNSTARENVQQITIPHK